MTYGLSAPEIPLPLPLWPKIVKGEGYECIKPCVDAGTTIRLQVLYTTRRLQVLYTTIGPAI